MEDIFTICNAPYLFALITIVYALLLLVAPFFLWFCKETTTVLRKTRIIDIKTDIYYRVINGRVIKILMPRFEGKIIDLGYEYNNPEYWDKHREKDTGCRAQVEEAKKRFKNMGYDLSEYDTHHLPSRKGHCRMQLVKNSDHEEHPHYGGASLNNDSWLEGKITQNGNYDLSPIKLLLSRMTGFILENLKILLIILGSLVAMILILFLLGYFYCHPCSDLANTPQKSSIEIKAENKQPEKMTAIYSYPAEALFMFDSYNLTAEAKLTIDTIIRSNRTSTKINIAGHTCKIGTQDYNKSLSWWRANTVKQYIEQKYPDKYELKVQSYGSTMCNAIDTADYKQFRKVTIEFE